MDKMKAEQTFCWQFLSRFVGIYNKTKRVFIRNNFKTKESLLSIDLRCDLVRMNGYRELTVQQQMKAREAIEFLKRNADFDVNVSGNGTESVSVERELNDDSLAETGFDGQSFDSTNGTWTAKRVMCSIVDYNRRKHSNQSDDRNDSICEAFIDESLNMNANTNDSETGTECVSVKQQFDDQNDGIDGNTDSAKRVNYVKEDEKRLSRKQKSRLDKKFVCIKCGKRFWKLYSLSNHMITKRHITQQ